MHETWKALPWAPDMYEVSDQGRVRSLTRKRYGEPLIRRLVADKDGYMRVSLFARGNPGRGNYAVARLVMVTFKGDPPFDGAQVRHLNGIRDDNRVENLAWGTQLENMRDRDRHGTTPKGSKNGRAILNEKQVTALRARHRAGVSITALAAEYGVSRDTVRSAIKYNWKHL